MVDFMVIEIIEKDVDTGACELEGLGFTNGSLTLKLLRFFSEFLKDKTSLDAKDVIEEIAGLSLLTPYPLEALSGLEKIFRKITTEQTVKILKDKKTLQGVLYICGSSRMLTSTLVNKTSLLEWLFFEGGLELEKNAEINKKEFSTASKVAMESLDFDKYSVTLREFKKKEILRIGARDLLGLAEVKEVTREVSDLAEATLEGALSFDIKELEKKFSKPLCTGEDGGECPIKIGEKGEASFVVIALGKLGGRELNFSSDIDVLYIYRTEQGKTTGVQGKGNSKIQLHEFFTKVAEKVTKLIGEVTSEGNVFRVDLDLRPEGQSGMITNSLRSAEVYYESWGRTWERSAMIKARPVAGDKTLGDEFIKMITPFVYRKNLDYSSIEEIKAMKEMIDQKAQKKNPETIDVKLGRGGIREIEFFCQAQQLIHGGRDKKLRTKATLETLERLVEAGLLEKDEKERLEKSYKFLRNLEHRIQIVEGRQTQTLPVKDLELTRVAKMMGFSDDGQGKLLAKDGFLNAFKDVTDDVYEIYRTLFYSAKEEQKKESKSEDGIKLKKLCSSETEAEEVKKLLEGFGFDSNESLLKLEKLLAAQNAPRLSESGASFLRRLIPRLILLASKTPDPDLALLNIEKFITATGRKRSLYSMLVENAPLAWQVVKIFGSSAFLSRRLIENPQGLELLLSEDLARPRRSAGEVKKELENEIKEIRELSGIHVDEKYEEKLAILRRFKAREVFRIGTNDLIGELTHDEVSAQLTATAESVLEVGFEIALRETEKKYGKLEGSDFFVMGLGKLGSEEQNYGSDLDIAFVYSEAKEGIKTKTKEGQRSVGSHEFYVTLAQKIIKTLTVRTKDGTVFEVDTRLRPSGSSGPLVVSKDSLLSYHKAHAKLWERQSMIRARAVAGNTNFGDGVIKELKEVIFSSGFSKKDAVELIRIRERMEQEIAKETKHKYDVKTGFGGLIDIEFLTQALQLKFGKDKPGLRASKTQLAISEMKKQGILTEKDSDFLLEALRSLRIIETGLRVVHDNSESQLIINKEETEKSLGRLARRVGYEGEDAGKRFLEDFLSKRGKVRELYLRVTSEL